MNPPLPDARIALRAKRRENHQCIKCGVTLPVDRDKVLCVPCLSAHRFASRKHYRTRVHIPLEAPLYPQGRRTTDPES